MCVFLSGLCALRNVKLIAQQVVRIQLKTNVDWRAHESSTRYVRTIYWFSMDDTSPSWPLSTKVLGVCLLFSIFYLWRAVSSKVECEWRLLIIACHTSHNYLEVATEFIQNTGFTQSTAAPRRTNFLQENHGNGKALLTLTHINVSDLFSVWHIQRLFLAIAIRISNSKCNVCVNYENRFAIWVYCLCLPF